MATLAIHAATMAAIAWVVRRSAYHGYDLPPALFGAVWVGSSLGWSAIVLLPLLRQGGSWRLGGIVLFVASTAAFIFVGFLASVKH
jgi:hypothetical protein